MNQRTPIRRISSKRLARMGGKVFSTIGKREKPRRKRPDLFYVPPKEETWEQKSLRLRMKWWKEATAKNEYPECVICGLPINQFRQMSPDHRTPGKMGGCKDHSEDNLGPAHVICNNLKGSKRNYTREQCLRDLGKISSMEE